MVRVRKCWVATKIIACASILRIPSVIFWLFGDPNPCPPEVGVAHLRRTWARVPIKRADLGCPGIWLADEARVGAEKGFVA